MKKIKTILRGWFSNPYFDILFAAILFINIHLLFWNSGKSDRPIFQTASAQGDLGYFFLDMGLLSVLPLAILSMVLPYFIKRRLRLKELTQVIGFGLLWVKAIIDYLFNGLQNPVGLFFTNMGILLVVMLIIQVVFDYIVKDKELPL